MTHGSVYESADMSEHATNTSVDSKRAIQDFLRSRGKKARFVTEVIASLKKFNTTPEEIDRALAELEAEGVVMVRDHFCADPHLAGVNLRIAAIIENVDGAQAQMNAIREIDSAWDKWLSSYLANHRCS
ncbi:MAG TPA: hypothetical protein VIB79_22580 [Candidatus Binatia bacterium]